MKSKTFSLRGVVLLFGGLLSGFLIPLFLRRHFLALPPRSCQLKVDKELQARFSPKPVVLVKRAFIFVGVMTAEKFLDNRAKAVYETWGKTLPGKLVFFSSSRSKKRDLPLVSLKGVDDSYPPQRKSMMMLKYMHDNYIDDFEWFMRSDDDVYIRTDKLANFLRTLNSSEDLYIGQAGTGRRDEKGMLGLGWGDNFCMGGPGVVMSRSTLKKVVPYVDYCLKHLVTTHEDVEVGRCVKMFVGISCTWAFEMQSLFYHNRSQDRAFVSQLNTKAVRNAITLHPVKKAAYMYRLHVHFMKTNIQDSLYASVTHQRRLNVLNRLLEKHNMSEIGDEVLGSLNDIRDFHHRMPKSEAPPWEMMTARKLFSFTHNAPEIGMINPAREGMNQVLGQTMMIVNQEARKVLHRTLEFKRLNHGYRRFHTRYGAQYMLDLLMKYHRHIGYNRRRMTVHVRHHAYLQQPFGNLLHTIEPIRSRGKTLAFLLPLAGRMLPFRRFLETYEKVCLKPRQNTKLLILYFKDAEPEEGHLTLFNSYKKKYPNADLRWISMKGTFSRSLALSMGASQFRPESLLFFCDVDLAFTSGFLDRCRLNSILGKQVYYPVVLSQFNPMVTYKNASGPESPFYFQRDAGFWRVYAFGITCMHRADFKLIGGFDTTIQGWGLEDVDLYDRFVANENYNVFRAPDPGLIHIYHDVDCDWSLPEKQLKMCFGSKAQSYGSTARLYELLLEKGHLTEKN